MCKVFSFYNTCIRAWQHDDKCGYGQGRIVVTMNKMVNIDLCRPWRRSHRTHFFLYWHWTVALNVNRLNKWAETSHISTSRVFSSALVTKCGFHFSVEGEMEKDRISTMMYKGWFDSSPSTTGTTKHALFISCLCSLVPSFLPSLSHYSLSVLPPLPHPLPLNRSSREGADKAEAL